MCTMSGQAKFWHVTLEFCHDVHCAELYILIVISDRRRCSAASENIHWISAFNERWTIYKNIHNAANPKKTANTQTLKRRKKKFKHWINGTHLRHRFIRRSFSHFRCVWIIFIEFIEGSKRKHEIIQIKFQAKTFKSNFSLDPVYCA